MNGSNLCVCVPVFVCVFICVCVCKHECVCFCMCVNACVLVCLHLCVRQCVCVYFYMFACVCVFLCLCACVCICLYVYVRGWFTVKLRNLQALLRSSRSGSKQNFAFSLISSVLISVFPKINHFLFPTQISSTKLINLNLSFDILSMEYIFQFSLKTKQKKKYLACSFGI